MARASAFRTFALCPLPFALTIALTAFQGQGESRAVAIFVDDMHIAALDTPRVRTIMRSVGDQLLRDDDLVGVVMSGRARTPFAFERDRARFDSEIRSIMGSASPRQPDPTPAYLAQQQRFADAAISTATEIVGNLERMANRSKVMLYFSGGYAAAGPGVDTALDNFARTSARAGVVVYHVDPARWGATAGPAAVSALDKLAAATGGFALTSASDFERLQTPAPVDYETFCKQDAASKKKTFTEITAENRADLVRTQIQRWMDANAARLNAKQIELLKESLAFVTPDRYRSGGVRTPEDAERSRTLQARMVEMFSRDEYQAMQPAGPCIDRTKVKSEK